MDASEAHVVIVTGAGGGLGGAMSRGLLAAGRRVVAVDLEAVTFPLARLSADAGAAASHLLTLTGDVCSPVDTERIVTAAVAHFGAVHGLVNCAGLGPEQRRVPSGGFTIPKFFELGVESWLRTIDTNVNGPYLMARAVTPHLLAQGWGKIVNIVTGYPTLVKYSPYGPSKAALEAATVVWASDLDQTGVTVNALLPGGAANTAMVPQELVPDRSRLVQPNIMVPPVVALTGHVSDGITARRIIALNWDEHASIEQNLARAEPAAWGISWSSSRSPVLH